MCGAVGVRGVAGVMAERARMGVRKSAELDFGNIVDSPALRRQRSSQCGAGN